MTEIINGWFDIMSSEEDILASEARDQHPDSITDLELDDMLNEYKKIFGENIYISAYQVRDNDINDFKHCYDYGQNSNDL